MEDSLLEDGLFLEDEIEEIEDGLGEPDLPTFPQGTNEELPSQFRLARSRIMYIEAKTGLEGDARIGRVYFSKSGSTLYYKGQRFRSLKGKGYKANYYDLETGDHYWISGPKKDRNDRLYGGCGGVEIDSDVYAEYCRYLRS